MARLLDSNGHAVTVIDTNADQFRRLGPEFKGETIIGTGIDEDVLRSAGIESADAFISVTQGDNTNVMTAQIAQNIFHVPRVMCRIYDPVREAVYKGMGLHTVCPTTVISDIILNDISAGEK